MAKGEVYFEFLRFGASVKVSAIDARSGTEVSVICPAKATQAQMKTVALNKLRYVLNKPAGPETSEAQAGLGARIDRTA